MTRQYYQCCYVCYRDAVVVVAGCGQAGGGHVLGEGDGLAQPQDGEVVLLGLAAVAGVALRAAHPRPDLAICGYEAVLPQQHPGHAGAAVGRGQHLPVTEQRAAAVGHQGLLVRDQTNLENVN